MPSSMVAVALPVTDRSTTLSESPGRNEAHTAGVSWPAVIGGAFVFASMSLILAALGAGLGMSLGATWWSVGSGTAAVGKAAIAWFILTEIIASALGGYLAGRLRTKWVHVHTDEVYFRDTAHGLLVWALGIVVTVSLLGAAASSLAKGAAQRSGDTVSTPGSVASLSDPNAYFVDTLFRSGDATAQASDSPQRAEAERIFSRSMREGAMLVADKTYLAQLVAARTGLNQSDAGNRVSRVFEDAQQSAETARGVFAHLSLWLFVALLAGAFCSSYAGTIGGKQRDLVRV